MSVTAEERARLQSWARAKREAKALSGKGQLREAIAVFEVEYFNRDVGELTPLIFTDAAGKPHATFARSKARLDRGVAVVKVDGIAGEVELSQLSVEG